MKKAYLFSLLFLSSPLSAEIIPARVTLVGNKKPINCSMNTDTMNYYCKEGERVLHISPFYEGTFSTRGNWEDPKKLDHPYVSKLEIIAPNETEYTESYINPYVTDDSLNFEVPPSPIALERSLIKNSLSSIQEEFLKSMDPNHKPVQLDHVEKEVIDLLDQVITSRLNELDKDFLDDNVEVTLKDGTKKVCKRSAGTKNDAYSHIGASACNIFNCGTGKNGATTLILDENSAHYYLYDISENGIYNTSPISDVSSSRGNSLWNSPAYNGVSQVENPMKHVPSIVDMSDYLAIYTSPYHATSEPLFFEKCAPQVKTNYEKAVDGFKNKLQNIELIQYISSQGDYLSSIYAEVGYLKSGHCHQDGSYYENPQTWQKTDRYSGIRPNKILPTITPEEAQELFDMAKEMNDIAWDYSPDGCYARAHLMARRFEERGIYVEKAWIKGHLKALDDNKNLIAEWNFHVAPSVHVKNPDGSINKVIIDPSIESGPVPVEKWAERMIDHGNAKVTQTSFPFPDNSAMFNKVSLAFSNSDPYLPYSPVNQTEADRQNQSNETMLRYKGITQ